MHIQDLLILNEHNTFALFPTTIKKVSYLNRVINNHAVGNLMSILFNRPTEVIAYIGHNCIIFSVQLQFVRTRCAFRDHSLSCYNDVVHTGTCKFKQSPHFRTTRFCQSVIKDAFVSTESTSSDSQSKFIVLILDVKCSYSNILDCTPYWLMHTYYKIA